MNGDIMNTVAVTCVLCTIAMLAGILLGKQFAEDDAAEDIASAEHTAAQRWISVKDRLPKHVPQQDADHYSVLALWRAREHTIVSVNFEPSSNGRDGYTHWMPLAPPPQICETRGPHV